MKIIAHRGIHSDVVEENSRGAVSSVLDSGAEGIEIDVRITSDDICVVHHDTHLKNGLRLSALNFEQLQKHQPDVMLVSDALEILKAFHGLINLEVKHLIGERDARRGRLCVEKLTTHIRSVFGENIGNVVVSSFSIPNIRHSGKNMPTIARAYLGPRPLSFKRIINRALKHDCKAVHLSVAQMQSKRFSRFMDLARNNDLDVRIYTVNTEGEFKMAKDLGVDAIFTDHVNEMKKIRENLLS